MKISKVVIHNFKKYKDIDIDVNKKDNVIVGDNGSGKTTFLEAINLCLTGRIDGHSIDKMLTSDLFNKDSVNNFLLHNGNLPKILIEVYIVPENDNANYRGVNNTLSKDSAGLSITIDFDTSYEQIYMDRRKNDYFLDLPVEYYKVDRRYFNGNVVFQRNNPFKVYFIDGTRKDYSNYVDRYIEKSINNFLSDSQKSNIKTEYFNFLHNFENSDELSSINENSLSISNHMNNDIKLSVKKKYPDEWLSELTMNINDMPYIYSGLGMQKIIKTDLVLNNSLKFDGILLFEEPETNLSYSNMSKLVSRIEKDNNKQNFISTHSSYVANKLGLNDLLLCNSGNINKFNNIESSSYNYFKKLPGYNTLRLILSNKVILVEGPTDELIINRAYFDQTSHLPIEDGIDVIVVESLAFKRYLDLANLIDKKIIIVTDNDGNINKNIKIKYKKYINNDKFYFCYEKNEKFNTLEPSIINANVENINKLKMIILGNNNKNDDYLEKFMLKNKANWGMKILDSNYKIDYPQYILDAIKEVKYNEK